jgi:hypothetical protein
MDLAFTPPRVMLGSAVLSAGIVILSAEAVWRHCLQENCAPSTMYESELSTCNLGAVVCVLLAAGIGFGWHYLDNAVAGPLLPQLRSHSTMRPVLRDRRFPLSVKAQCSMCHSCLADPATPTSPQAPAMLYGSSLRKTPT